MQAMKRLEIGIKKEKSYLKHHKEKMRKRIAVDEKEMTINGATIFIWGSVDLDDEKVIAVWVFFGRSSLEAAAFLKKQERLAKGVAKDVC